MTTATLVKTRIGWLDGARGLSIAAMIVSHVGLVVGFTPDWFHLYVMRPFAPVFLILLGMLWRPGWRRRHWQLVGGAVVAQGCAWVLGIGLPNILVLMLAAVIVAPVLVRWPVASAIVSGIQLGFWPVPEWWTGYQPGFVALFVLIGTLRLTDGFVEGYGRLGSRLGLETVGRHPLAWYLGHLLLLTFAWWSLT